MKKKQGANTDETASARMRGACVLAGLLVFFVAAGGALGVVWLRQQISTLGEYSLKYEAQLREWERKTTFLENKVARATSLEYLEGRLAAMGGGMGPPADEQVVWMAPARGPALVAGSGDAGAASARRENRAGGGEFALLEPLSRSWDRAP